jgi:protein TIF31
VSSLRAAAAFVSVQVPGVKGSPPTVLNMFLPVSEYAGLVDGAVVRMVRVPYDMTTAQAHVRRVREVIRNPPMPTMHATQPTKDSDASAAAGGADDAAGTATTAPAGGAEEGAATATSASTSTADAATVPAPVPAAAPPASKKEKEEKKKGKKDEAKASAPAPVDFSVSELASESKTSLADLYNQPPLIYLEADADGDVVPVVDAGLATPTTYSAWSSTCLNVFTSGRRGIPLPTCVKSITLSAWNPPPASRRLLGDLFYIEVILDDNFIVHVTATASGFYINRTHRERFNPLPAQAPCHSFSLVAMLSTVSPKFRKAYTQVRE